MKVRSSREVREGVEQESGRTACLVAKEEGTEQRTQEQTGYRKGDLCVFSSRMEILAMLSTDSDEETEEKLNKSRKKTLKEYCSKWMSYNPDGKWKYLL